VISRVHPSLVGGPDLVHVDAYRLGGAAELDDLDLDTDLDRAITVVEWGEGLAEDLADSPLEIRILRTIGGDAADDTDPRTVEIDPLGHRWLGVDLPA
jgi:tRNA threonylcarbamoyladenosine biosynthesis protein TsaE